MTVKPNYLELRAPDLAAAQTFYERAFGFAFTSYGENYSAVEGGAVTIGLLRAPVAPPLPLFESQQLDDDLARVLAAGAVLVKPIESYPGGRRFHVKDPAGNEIAVYQSDA